MRAPHGPLTIAAETSPLTASPNGIVIAANRQGAAADF
jgi:hypothetical protein